MEHNPPTLNFEPPHNEVPPPAYDEPMTNGTSLDKKRPGTDLKDKETHLDVDVRSVNSATSSTIDFSDTLLPNASFTPGSSFHVASRGVAAFRLPLPSSELEIEITNSNGSVAYTSTRARKSKGDCILASREGGDLISTNYFFGPQRQPILKDLSQFDYSNPISGEASKPFDKTDSLFDIKSKWNSRAIIMVHRPTGKVFEWSYEKTRTADKKKALLLVLRLKDNQSALEVKGSDDESDGKGKVIAQLIRSETTRTPGTKSCTAGNGGQLVLDRDAAEAMEEPLIIATSLMMLKKEIDRRRAIQFMILAGGAGGGGG